MKEDGVHIVFRKITNEVEFLKLQMKQKMNEMKARRNGSTMARRKEVKKQNNWITKDSRITKLMVEEYEYVCGVMDKINPEVKVPTPPELLVDVEAIKLQMKQIIIQAIVTSEDKKTVVSSLMRDPYLNYLQNVTGIQLSEVVKETVEVYMKYVQNIQDQKDQIALKEKQDKVINGDVDADHVHNHVHGEHCNHDNNQ